MSESATPALCSHCGILPVLAKGLCSTHYQMVRKYGVPVTGWHDPDEIRQRRIEFFWANVDKRGPDECWPWKRKPSSGGHGQLRWFTGQISAHRAAYILAYGEVPEFPGERTNIDHTCHDPKVCDLKTRCPHRMCCNPAHLEAVTHGENLRRGEQHRPDNGGGKACEPGCTCKRHKGYNHAGGVKCQPGCTCGRHKPRRQAA